MKTIPLTQGKVALVDDEDFDRVNQFNWYACRDRKNWYARRKLWIDGKQTTIHLHHVIFGVSIPIDHLDNGGLNNQSTNLRVATNSQNQANCRKQKNRSSKYKGVTWDRWTERWMAKIKFNQHTFHLMRWDSEKDAAIAYDTAAKAYFGEFAKLNFP